MSDTNLTEFYPYTIFELPGCPKSLVMLHVREVARDFFHRSQVWEEELDAIDVAAGTADYDIPAWQYDLDAPQRQAEVDAVTKVEVKGSVLTAGRHYSLDNTKTILTLDFIPDANETDGLVVTVALVPVMAATSMPERLFNDWHEVIAAGVKSRLMRQPGKRWSDLKTAGIHDAEYFDGVRAAIAERTRRRTNKTVIVKPRHRW